MSKSFDDTWRELDEVQGWMSRSQAGRLWDRASELRPGAAVVEIGSFHGRSAIVLATAAPDGTTVVAIDPHGGNDRGPQEISGFETEASVDHEVFHRNLDDAGVADRVRHVRAFSDAALDEVEGPVDLLYVDGAHRYRPALDDLQRWGDRVAPGGTMLVHDSFSSIGVTLALLVLALTSRRWRYVGRSRSMAELHRDELGLGAWAANVARHVVELGWFARNVTIKVLLSARQRRLAALLGSDGDWPY
jgi:predicted O-methyltransferase YrrM